jgi:glycerol uptake facilitator protein
MPPPRNPQPLPGLPACCLAEGLGTFLLVLFGCGAVHVAVLTDALQGLWQVGIVWGIAIMLAVLACGAISGAHINPAITIALAAWRKFPARRIPAYLAAQLLGALAAAAVLYALFAPFLAAKEQEKGISRGQPGSELTAMCYGEYFPNPGPLAVASGRYDPQHHAALRARVPEWAACLAELLGTAILAFMVAALTDTGNALHPGRLAAVFIGLTVTALICLLAPLTQACFNPARDFGPRLFAYFAGWGEIALPGPQGRGFFTVYIASPIVGAVAGMGLYGLLRRMRPADCGADC